MPISRADFIAGQKAFLDRFFALAPGEDEARQRFERLALETRDCIAGKVFDGPLFPYPSADNFADYDRGAGALVPPSLRERWRAWQGEYRRLVESQPLLELHDLLHAISESHNCSSWPAGWEAKIRDWVDAGYLNPIPFDDIHCVATTEFYRRLRELRGSIGGWLYWNEVERAIKFVAD